MIIFAARASDGRAAAAVAALRKPPLFPIKPLDEVQDWLRQEIAVGNEVALKPMTVLLVPFGMGASTTIRRVIRADPAHPGDNPRILSHPAVLAHLPAKGDATEIGAQICDTIGAPSHHIGGTPHNPRMFWLRTLQRIGMRMLILDDFRSLSLLAKSRQATMLNVIRYAISRYDLQVLVIAPPELRVLVMDDPQLAGRARLIEILPFKVSDPWLKRLPDAFQRWCPLRLPSDLLADQGLRYALVHRSSGIHGTCWIFCCSWQLSPSMAATSGSATRFGATISRGPSMADKPLPLVRLPAEGEILLSCLGRNAAEYGTSDAGCSPMVCRQLKAMRPARTAYRCG